MMYQRVLPRDLFNEAKLLKCLGQLSLLIHDGVRWPLELEHTNPMADFHVGQRREDGGLYCFNLRLLLDRREVVVYSGYNSKLPYPLQFEGWDGDAGYVFDDDGRFTTEFTEWLDRQITNRPTST